MASFEDFVRSSEGLLRDATSALRVARAQAKDPRVIAWIDRRARELDDQIASTTRDIEDSQAIAETLAEVLA